MSNWDARDLTLDFLFLGDGVKTDHEVSGYKKETIKISFRDKLNILFEPGRRWAARIEKSR